MDSGVLDGHVIKAAVPKEESLSQEHHVTLPQKQFAVHSFSYLTHQVAYPQQQFLYIVFKSAKNNNDIKHYHSTGHLQ